MAAIHVADDDADDDAVTQSKHKDRETLEESPVV